MKKIQRSRHSVQWAAQFAVASELCRRNYGVAFTQGNHPTFDLMVASPKGRSFFVDVKGLSGPNPWRMREKAKHPRLFYVLVVVPQAGDGSTEFFILTQKQANRCIQDNLENIKARKKFTSQKYHPCVRRPAAAPYKDRWDILPE